MVTVHHRPRNWRRYHGDAAKREVPVFHDATKEGPILAFAPRRGGCKGRSARPSAFESKFADGLVCRRDVLPGP